MATRELIVDDFEPWRCLIYSSLQLELNAKVVGEAADRLTAILKGRELQPDLIVLNRTTKVKRHRSSLPSLAISPEIQNPFRQ